MVGMLLIEHALHITAFEHKLLMISIIIAVLSLARAYAPTEDTSYLREGEQLYRTAPFDDTQP